MVLDEGIIIARTSASLVPKRTFAMFKNEFYRISIVKVPSQNLNGDVNDMISVQANSCIWPLMSLANHPHKCDT